MTHVLQSGETTFHTDHQVGAHIAQDSLLPATVLYFFQFLVVVIQFLLQLQGKARFRLNN